MNQKRSLKRGDDIPRQLLQVVLDGGGLGDTVARLVAVRESLQLCGYLDMRIFVWDYCVPLVDATSDLKSFIKNGRLAVHKMQDVEAFINKQQPIIQMSKRTHSPGRMSLVDEGLLAIADTLDSINGLPVDKYWVTVIPENDNCHEYTPKKVALTVEGRAPVRTWREDEQKKLASWLVENGYQVVVLGSDSKDQEEFVPGVKDLRGKLTLLQTQSELNTCEYVLGLDNGLMNLAGTCINQPKIIGAYTSINPKYRKIIVNNFFFEQIKLGEDGTKLKNLVVKTVRGGALLEDRYSQSRHNFLFEHDFREYLYEGDDEITKVITAERFIEALLEAESEKRW